MNLVDWLRISADERLLSGRCAVVICVMGCLRGLIVLHWPFISREQSLWSFSGLDSCVLAYFGSAAPLEGYWCCRTWVQWSPCIGGAKCGLIASNEREVPSFLGLQGRGYNEALALEVRNVAWLRRTKEKCQASLVCNGSLHVRCRAVVPGVLACVYVYILYVCVYICVCVYVCGHVRGLLRLDSRGLLRLYWQGTSQRATILHEKE